jgi:hypothetical protein
MMSEKPENRMPLSQPERSAGVLPPVDGFAARPLRAWRDDVEPRTARAGSDFVEEGAGFDPPRGLPEDRGGRGASGCIAPPHRPGKENGGGPTAAPVTRSKPVRP